MTLTTLTIVITEPNVVPTARATGPEAKQTTVKATIEMAKKLKRLDCYLYFALKNHLSS